MQAKTLAKIIAANVRNRRLAAELTQERFASKVGKGCTVPMVSRLESGRHLPSVTTLLAIANALGVSVADLVTAHD